MSACWSTDLTTAPWDGTPILMWHAPSKYAFVCKLLHITMNTYTVAWPGQSSIHHTKESALSGFAAWTPITPFQESAP